MRAHGFSLRCQRHGAPHSNRQAVSAESCNPRSLLGLVRCLDRWTVPPEKGPRCGTKKWGDFSWHFFPKKKGRKTQSASICHEGTVNLYHLESRWRNSHVLGYHGPLLIHRTWELCHLLSRWYKKSRDFLMIEKTCETP